MTPMTKTQIEAAILSIAKRGAKLDADIQAAGLAIIHHVGEHGDITLANKLFLAMPKGSRRNSLALWFITFAKLDLNTGEGRKDAPFVYKKDGKTDVQGAAKMMWFDAKPEADVTAELDGFALVRAMLKKIDTAVSRGQAVTGLTDDQVAVLRGLLPVEA